MFRSRSRYSPTPSARPDIFKLGLHFSGLPGQSSQHQATLTHGTVARGSKLDFEARTRRDRDTCVMKTDGAEKNDDGIFQICYDDVWIIADPAALRNEPLSVRPFVRLSIWFSRPISTAVEKQVQIGSGSAGHRQCHGG